MNSFIAAEGVVMSSCTSFEMTAVVVGAWLVVDDDRLAERLLQRLLHDARHVVGRAAGGVRNDDADRLVGEGLGSGEAGESQRRGADRGAQRCPKGSFHRCLLWFGFRP